MAIQKAKKPILQDCDNCATRKDSVFCNLCQGEIEEFNQSKSCNTYKKGQIIFNEGNNPYGLFCISVGKVKVFRTGQDGKDQIVRMAKDGDVIGYRALLTSETYNASAVALEDCDICFIPRDSFFRVLKDNNKLSLGLIKLLADDLKKAEQTITDLAQKTVRERMAEALLFLRQTYGLEADGQTISVVLSREEMASLVGTATETAIRLLSEFKNDGIVAFAGKKIQILNNEKLIRTANIDN